MREIVVSMQNTLLSEAVARSLAETGEFRVEQVLPGKSGDTNQEIAERLHMSVATIKTHTSSTC